MLLASTSGDAHEEETGSIAVITSVVPKEHVENQTNNMENEKFTIREKIALKLIIVLMAVLKPTKWSHEYANELKDIKTLIDEN